jgi:excisionase family DNA binding protein
MAELSPWESSMDQPLLISKRHAAAMLGLSVRTLENLISLKELPARRIGRRCLLEKAALERFVRRDHRTQPTSDEPFMPETDKLGTP